VGDLLLRAVARRLTDCTRKSDIVGRIGGDEFVILLAEIPREEDISPVAEKIIDAVSSPYEDLEGHRIVTSPSIGIAVYPRDGSTIESLLLNADAAMYKSKQSGRGRYHFFDVSLNRVSIAKFDLEQRMPAAIEKGEFVLHYQPKIRLADYRVVGLEALVRWQHPDHQLVFPSDFIEIAEETGLIADLGSWVLGAACEQLARWRSSGLDPVPVSINVSPRELTDPAYADRFFTTLARHRTSPRDIEIEITENALIRDRDIVVSNLEILHSKGVTIFLDDFGKGFSSLEYIRSLPIHALKIDRSFVQDIRNSHQDNPIVSSAVILAHKLNLTVVAEGIETHEQLVHLKVLDCDQVQGYFFSRPQPEEIIREFIVSPVRNITS
jgi:predicted signal transduction protein with EAL and GGDEF domain